MKTIYLTSIILLYAFAANAQITISQGNEEGDKWTREARSGLYSYAASKLASYTNLKEQDKQTISQCYMTEIEGKYKKSEYESKIEIELKQIFESTIELCAQKAGVRLNKKQSSKALSRKDLIGHWDSGAGRFYLQSSSQYTMNYMGKKKAETGTWSLNGTVLRLNKKGKAKKGVEYKINLFAGDQFTFQNMKKKKEVYTANRLADH